ncbi:MAG: SLC13 family permease [Thermoanaerobaculia bacterium]|nr:SLC13 family permease [Thermoanaerobaculia bacterium]
MAFEFGFQAALTLAVLVATVVLFVTERLRVDLVALLALGVLLVAGVLEPAVALSGFANPAVVTVAAMFVLSSGLLRSGAGERAGLLLARAMRRRPTLGLLLLMVTVGSVSAFINNTAAVAIMLPIVLGVSRRIGIAASRLLMPLSFASMFGGVCTLIGTSTNLLASQIAQDSGLAAISMFELAPLGLAFFAAGVTYMMTVGRKLIPDRGVSEDLAESFGLGDYLTDLALSDGSSAAGRTLTQVPEIRDLDLDVLEIRRGEDQRNVTLPLPDARLRPGDVLRVRGSLEAIRSLAAHEDFELLHARRFRDRDLEGRAPGEKVEDGALRLLEAVVPPGSGLEGSTLEESQFRTEYGATVLAIRHRGKLRRERIKSTRLIAGDTLLLEIKRERLPQLRGGKDLVVVSDVEVRTLQERRLLVAVVILVAMVASAASGLLPIVSAAVAGCLAMVLTRCLTLDEAYQAIDWKIIFLLGGVIGLGRALESSGLAGAAAGFLVDHFQVLGPIAVLSGFYLLTSLLTESMSNNATVVLLGPIAVGTAGALGVDPRPFLVAVTAAASASFMTPVGYQTNTLIYGPGRYRFSDFIKVGGPLNLLFWILATFLIPLIWPLTPV